MKKYLFLFILAQAGQGCAQVMSSDRGINACFGLGDNSAAHSDLGTIIGAEYHFQKFHVGLQRAHHGEFLRFDTPVQRTRAISAMMGLSRKQHFTAWSLSAGVGHFMSVRRGELLYSPYTLGSYYTTLRDRTVCLDLMARILVHLRGNGLGVALHANLNPQESYAAAYFFVQTGLWWVKRTT